MSRIWSALKFATPTARAAVSSPRGIIACYNKFGRRLNDQWMFVLIMQTLMTLHSKAITRWPLATLGFWSNRDRWRANEKE